jgi:hypothetical protein
LSSVTEPEMRSQTSIYGLLQVRTDLPILCAKYLISNSGRCISGDATFKIGAKSTLSDPKGKRTKVMKGGLISYINEVSEILAWVRDLTFMNGDAPDNRHRGTPRRRPMPSWEKSWEE